MYKAQTNQDYMFWEVLSTDRAFRKSLVRQCYNTFLVIQEGFGYFTCNH